jgi:hypothetical protein
MDHPPKGQTATNQPLEFDRMDRTVMRVFNSFEEAERHDREFWLSRTPVERMQALEQIRQHAWGYSNAEPQPQFPRVVAVAELRRR